MSRLNARTLAAFVALLLFIFPQTSFAQSAPPDEILQWENDIALFDSLNLVEFADAGTLLVTGSSSIRLWDSIDADLAPYQVMQRGYGGAKLTDYNYYAERIILAQQFKAIVVFVANDIAGVEGDQSPREVKQLFKDLVKQVRSRNPGTPLCWVEVSPTSKRWEQSPTHEGIPDSTFFRKDMLHLNRSGYLQWSEIIKASLEEAGIGP